MKTNLSILKSSILELQHLEFNRISPQANLRHWVQCYWSIGNTPKIIKNSLKEKLYPDGGVSLVFNTSQKDDIELWIKASTEMTYSNNIRNGDMFGIHFQPGAANKILNFTPNKTIAIKLDEDEIRRLNLKSFCNKIKTSSVQKKIAIIEHWLLQKIENLNLSPGFVQFFWPQLIQDKNISGLILESGISRRKLERLFETEIGFSPGQLRQLLRIKLARYLIKTHPRLSLTDIALKSGYFDQAHFNRHFFSIVKETPGKYRKRQKQRRELGQLIVN